MKRIKEASGHSYTPKAGWKAAKKDLDAALAVILKAIRDRQDIPVRGQLGIGDKGEKPIPWRWFHKHPEPIAFYEMSVLALGTLTDIDGNEQPDLQNGWTGVEFDLDAVERLRDKTRSWPLKKRTVTAEPQPVVPEPPKEGPPESRERGRPRIWEWERAAIAIASSPEGLSHDQAEAKRQVETYFFDKHRDHPSDSLIREHVAVWHEELPRKEK